MSIAPDQVERLVAAVESIASDVATLRRFVVAKPVRAQVDVDAARRARAQQDLHGAEARTAALAAISSLEEAVSGASPGLTAADVTRNLRAIREALE